MTFAEWWYKIGSGITPRLYDSMYDHAMRVAEMAWIAADQSIVNDDKGSLPFLAIGNDELKGPLGDNIICPHCSKEHPLEYGRERMPDGTMRIIKAISFYCCGDKTYVGGINGMAI